MCGAENFYRRSQQVQSLRIELQKVGKGVKTVETCSSFSCTKLYKESILEMKLALLIDGKMRQEFSRWQARKAATEPVHLGQEAFLDLQAAWQRESFLAAERKYFAVIPLLRHMCRTMTCQFHPISMNSQPAYPKGVPRSGFTTSYLPFYMDSFDRQLMLLQMRR